MDFLKDTLGINTMVDVLELNKHDKIGSDEGLTDVQWSAGKVKMENQGHSRDVRDSDGKLLGGVC